MHKGRRRRAAGPIRRSQCRHTNCECAANSLKEQQLRRHGLGCGKKGADQDREVAVASDNNHHHLKHAAALPTTTSSPLAATAPDANRRFIAPRLDQRDNDRTGQLTWTLRSSSFHAISTAPTTLQVVTSTSTSASPTSAIGADAVETTGAEWTISDTPPRPSLRSSSTPTSTPAMGTTGLAIAAICIGATLVAVTVAFGIYVMRTKGLTFSDVFRRKARPRHRIDRTYDIAKPTVHRMPAYAWDDRKPSSYAQSVPLPRRPEPAATRNTETASRYTPAASQSGLLKPSPRPSTPPGLKSPSNTSFLDDASPPRNSSRQSNHSREPSSPNMLPLQRQHTHTSNMSDHTVPPFFIQSQDPPRENSFYRSREGSINLSRENSVSRSRENSLNRRSRGASISGWRDTTSFLAEDEDTLATPNLPVPSFQQFMANRTGPPTGRARGLTRTSQSSTLLSPSQTPVDASFGGEYNRESTTSLARFRSVDSWVGQQTSRIESTEFSNQPHFSFMRQNSSGLGQVDEGQAGWRGETEVAAAAPDVPFSSAPYYRDGGLAAGHHHRRQNTNYSDATVFRVHPGSEIKIPRGSLVPSEVLDANVVPSAL